MYYYQFDLDAWKHFEIIRQNDKSINNKIGEFHQNLLGCVEGWIDLGRGDETGVDLKNEDETIFIELKNKHNTMNASSSKTCRENLENILKKYPNATVYWAVIIDKNYISEDIPWEYKGNMSDQIRKISGDKLYALVTGKEDAYEQLFSAISSAINDILDADYYLSYLDHEKIEEFKRKILDR